MLVLQGILDVLDKVIRIVIDNSVVTCYSIDINSMVINS